MRQIVTSNIKAFVMDVDGVLTDGRIGYAHSLEGEIKFFDVKDGTGISMLRRVGIVPCIISGRESNANVQRLETELKIEHVMQKIFPKEKALLQFCERLNLTPDQCAYMGDDLIDINSMHLSGLAIAPADAVPEVLAEVDWVTTRKAGRGAVREAIDRLLHSMGLFDKAAAKFLGGK